MNLRRLAGCPAVIAAIIAATSAPLARDAVRQVPLSAPVPEPAPAAAAGETPPSEPGQGRPARAGERASLSVLVDRAKVIRLPASTQTVVIGNPAIADIAVQKNGIVVVTGKSYGTTNLIAMDGAGNMLAESTVSVAAPTDNILVVQRGFERQTYSCTPACQPSIILGDSTPYFSDNRGQAEARNQFAISR